MFLNRLPPEYRRRAYMNMAVVAGFFIFIFIVGRLDERTGSLAILGFIGLLFLWLCAWPLLCLLRYKPRPARPAFLLYAAWIAAYAYVALGFWFPQLPGVRLVIFTGLVLMLVFFAIYRKIVFPSVFGGGFRERWRVVREAQRAERAERESLIQSMLDR